MMRAAFVFVVCTAISGCQMPVPNAGADFGRGAKTASMSLDRLVKDSREKYLDLFPLEETMDTGPGPRQDRLEMYFTGEHRERQRRYHEWVLSSLRDIPLQELNRTERLTHRLLARESELGLAGLKFPFDQHFIFIQLDGGMANDLVKLVGRQPFRNGPDYRAWFSRLRRYPAFMDGVSQLMKEGMASGITIPRTIVERSLAQLDALAPPDQEMTKSALWKPMTQMPGTIDAASRNALEAEYRQLLASDVFPAARRLARFVREEYLPRARTTPGFGALPRGAEMYRLLVRWNTTTDMTPDAIHELGLKEVKRIQEKVTTAAAKVGYAGPVKDLGRWIQSKPEYFPFTTGQEVLDYLNGINARIVSQLPKFFGRMPKARFEIRLTDPAIAGSAPAQWYPPSDDGTRPGIFAIPVVDARQRSSIGLASLLAHEGMPGHHFDGSIQREGSLPEFRRQGWITAFGEGWALYAEFLGHDLGIYEDPPALIGRYMDELYRSGRLVVDTGLHAKGWTRERAIRYMMEECAFEQTRAEREVDRYMAWPAQALGYKLGELTIHDIRAKAQARLGPRFDIRKFHDALLEEGHLPLNVLRERMDTWIAEQ